MAKENVGSLTVRHELAVSGLLHLGRFTTVQLAALSSVTTESATAYDTDLKSMVTHTGLAFEAPTGAGEADVQLGAEEW